MNNVNSVSAKKLWTVDELLAANGGPLPMSKAGIYKMVKEGKFESVRVGKRVFIPDWFVRTLYEPPKVREK